MAIGRPPAVSLPPWTRPHLEATQKPRVQAFCGSEAQEPLVGCGPGPNCIHLFYKEVCLSAFPTSVLAWGGACVRMLLPK